MTSDASALPPGGVYPQDDGFYILIFARLPDGFGKTVATDASVVAFAIDHVSLCIDDSDLILGRIRFFRRME